MNFKSLSKFAFLFCIYAVGNESVLPLPNNETRKFALLVSANNGGNDKIKLQYPESDAKSLKNILFKLGQTHVSDITMLHNPTGEEFFNTVHKIRENIASISGQYKKTEFLLYYSGHADFEGLLLGEDVVYYKSIRKEIKSMPADVKIVILDSCSSGALTRLKGGKRRLPFIYNPAYDTRGEAFLTSSSADEVSQESDKIRASFFTYYLVMGLYGAADYNNDKQVTLTEAYQYAYTKTLARTERSAGGPQHPSFDIQMTGTGDVVLTNLKSGQSILSFDNGVNGQLFVRDSQERLVAELEKVTGQKTGLGLDGGEYNVILLQRNKMFEANVNLARNEEKVLSENNFNLKSADESEIRRLKGISADSREEDKPDYDKIVIKLSDIKIPEIDTSKKLPDIEIQGLSRFNTFNFQIVPESGIEREPIGISLFLLSGYLPDVTMLSVAGLVSIIGNDITGVQSSGIGNIVGNNQIGLQLAGIFNVNRHNGVGLQVAGFFNINDGNYKGMQAAGLFNINRFSVEGPQFAGVYNYAGSLDSIQVAVAANIAGQVKGVQLSSVLNYAENMNGLQIGLVNISAHGNGLGIGLFTLYFHEEHHAELWGDETGYLKAAYRNSTKNFHYIYGVGSNLDFNSAALIYGIGGHFPIGDKMSLALDFIENMIVGSNASQTGFNSFNDFKNMVSFVQQIRLSFNLQLVKQLALYCGAELSFMIDGVGNSSFEPQFVSSQSWGSQKVWPGFFIGIRF